MDLIDRASVLKAIDDYERLSAVSQTVRNAASLREIVQWLPAIDAVDRRALVETIKHYAQYPDGMSRLLEVYGAERRTDEQNS